jgi:ATP-dependent Lon protease
VPVKWIDRVLEVALERMPEPLAEEEATVVAAEGEAVKPGSAAAGVDEVVKH